MRPGRLRAVEHFEVELVEPQGAVEGLQHRFVGAAVLPQQPGVFAMPGKHLHPAFGLRHDQVVPQRGAPFEVRLVATSPMVESGDGTVRTWFEPVADVSLPHGAACRLRVLVDAASGAVAVPAKAVGLHGGKAVVLSRKAGAPVEVVVLASSGADALVKGPIAPGDEVAAEAPLASAEGEP